MPEDELFARRALALAAAGRSFTAAARALGVDVSTVTRVVERVERSLGARLFTRTPRGVAPTEAGALYLAHVERVLHGEGAVREAIGAVVSGEGATFRVTVPVFVAQRVLPDVLVRLREAHPGVRVHVHASDDTVELAGGAFDLAVRLGPLPDHLAPPSDPALRSQRVAEYSAVVVAAPALLGRRARPQHPSELAALPCLAYGAAPGKVEWRLRSGRERASVIVDPVVRTNDVALLAALAARGAGVALLPEWAVPSQAALVRVCEAWAARGRLFAVYPDDPGRARLRRAFLAELARAAREPA
jgi:DNA-binding transcriptional LysR family regulator